MHQQSVSHKHHAIPVNLVYKEKWFFTYSSKTILYIICPKLDILILFGVHYWHIFLERRILLHTDKSEMTKRCTLSNDNLHILVCHEVWGWNIILHQPHMHSRAEKEGARKKINLSEVSTTSASTWRSSRKVCVMLSLLCAFTYRDLNRLKEASNACVHWHQIRS